MSNTEQWREIPGFPGYEVSDMGRVRSWKLGGPGTRLASSPSEVRPQQGRHGYVRVELCHEGQRSHHFVHRIVLTAFVGPSKLSADHVNAVKDDNRLANLQWLTQAENVRRSAGARLTRDQVSAIRSRYGRSGLTQRALADEYGVSRTTIGDVVNGRSWVGI